MNAFPSPRTRRSTTDAFAPAQTCDGVGGSESHLAPGCARQDALLSVITVGEFGF